MSSLVRRSLRTTAAAAGIAAIGVGLAGPALAAPEVPALPGADGIGAVPALPDASGLQEMLAAVPAPLSLNGQGIQSAGPQLPTLEAFKLPTAPDLAALKLPMAGPSLPTAPAVPAAPAAPDASAVPTAPSANPLSGIANTELGIQQLSGQMPSMQSLMQNNAPAVTSDPSLAQSIASEHTVRNR